MTAGKKPEEQDPQFEITVVEPAPDLVREDKEVARTFENPLSQAEITGWGNKAETDFDREVEAAVEAATVEIGAEPNYEWLEQMANGRAFEVNPVIN